VPLVHIVSCDVVGGEESECGIEIYETVVIQGTPRNVIDRVHEKEWEWRLVVDASSEDVTTGDRTLVEPLLLLGHADAGVRGVRRSVRRVCRSGRGGRTRDGRIRVVGVGGNAGGGRGSRVGRAVISEADDLGTRNDESIEGVGIDIRPLEPVVHPGEAGEFRWRMAGRRLHSSR